MKLFRIVLLTGSILLTNCISYAQKDTAAGKDFFDKGKLAQDKYQSSKALKYFIKASDAGYLPANERVATYYFNGLATKMNYEKGFEYTNRGAEGGDPVAMFAVGIYYNDGKGVERDSAKGLYWITKSGNSGNVRAMQWLGQFYHSQSVYHNENTALDWYRKAAAANDLESLRFVMTIDKDAKGLYETGLKNADNEGVPWSTSPSFAFYRAASDMGYIPATLRLYNIFSHWGHNADMAMTYFKLLEKQGYKPTADERNTAEQAVKYDNDHPAPSPPSQVYSSAPKTNSTKTCPFCHGTGQQHSVASKGIDQDKNGRWYNTYTPASTSACAYCKGKGYL